MRYKTRMHDILSLDQTFNPDFSKNFKDNKTYMTNSNLENYFFFIQLFITLKKFLQIVSILYNIYYQKLVKKPL